MLRRLPFPLFVVALLAVAVVSEMGPSENAGAGTAAPEVAPTAGRPAGSSSTTARAVSAARAFASSLSSSQRAALQYPFGSSKKRTGWSNLPVTFVARNGVEVADLSARQRGRLRTLLRTILSARGYADEEAVRRADDYLTAAQETNTAAPAPGGPAGPGGADLQYGSGLYSIAFFGTPSTSEKWTVQFGGHHLALHMTFSGSTLSNTPYFVGAEPRGAFTVDGRRYNPMADEARALFGAVRSLGSRQRARARLSGTFDDVLVGPGEDGEFPRREGITVATLRASQQRIVTRAIRSYVGDMPATEAAARVADYRRQYARTALAYSGATDGTTSGGYVRLHGPRLWIEIVVQDGIVLSGTHYHSIERDIETDYGAGT